MSKEQVRDILSRTNTPDIDSTDVNMAFGPASADMSASEYRQSQQDWLDYLKGRNYVDAGDNIRDVNTANHEFTALDVVDRSTDRFGHMVDVSHMSAENSRSGLGVIELANAAREARERGDRTSLSDIEDEINEKIIEAADKYGWGNDQTMKRLDQINDIIHGDASSEEEIVPLQNENNPDVEPLQNENDPEEEIIPLQNESDPDVEPLQNESDPEEVEPLENESSPEQEKSQVELALEAARNEYAKATAHDRKSFWGRFLESDSNFFSRFIKEIPGAMQLAEFVNKNFTRHEFMDKARSEYEKALKADIDEKFAVIDESAEPSKQGEIDAILQNAEGKTEEEVRGLVEAVEKKYSPENILLQKMLIGTSEDALLEAQIIKERTEQSGKAGRLTSWWARQQGITGKLKKAGLVVAGGVLVGATVATGGLILGLGAVPAVATIAGGATGAGMGLRLNRGLAGAIVEKGSSVTVAQKESDRDRIRKAEDLKATVDSNEYRSKVRGDSAEDHLADILTQNVIGGTEKSTAERVKGNRNRLKSIIGLMALGGRLGSGLVDTVNSSVGTVEAKPVDNKYADPEDIRDYKIEPQSVEPAAETPGGIDPAEVPGPGEVPDQVEPVEQAIKGTEFVVDKGHGYTHELREFATVNGKQLSGQEAWNLHNDIMKQFGQDYIDIGGPGNDIYRQAGDVRLMEPGAATWKEGVPEYIMEWMKQRGL